VIKKFAYGKSGKLVRSKCVEILLRDDPTSQAKYHYLSKDELKSHLLKKLEEEAFEVVLAESREELVSELADVFEVIESICRVNNICREEIEVARANKLEKRGSFDDGLFIEWIEITSGTRLYNYCLAHQDKYPEVKGED